MLSWMIFSLQLVIVVHAKLTMQGGDGVDELMREALNDVLGAASQHRDFTIVIRGEISLLGSVSEVRAPWGVGMFEVGFNGTNDTELETHLSQVVQMARSLRVVSWSATVVVVSDDPAFLATFAKWSLKGRLLVWSTRLLVLTRLPLHRLHHFRNTIAMTNSMLLHATHDPEVSVNVYVDLPYSPPGSEMLAVASWTPADRLRKKLDASYYPEKFAKLSNGPRLSVSRVVFSTDKSVIVDDPAAPGEKMKIVINPENTLIETIAETINFKIKYVEPSDEEWGMQLSDGSWTGMVGMVHREEADIGLGLFTMTPIRNQVVDFTHPATIIFAGTFAARGTPEVDPWSFLLPMTPLVWLALLLALLGVVVVSRMLSNIPLTTEAPIGLQSKAITLVRILLLQDINESAEWWWWERVVVGVWMLMTLVLTKSYAGNLVSQLAVRYVSEPLQTLEDLVQSSVKVLIYQGSSEAEAFMTAKSGVYRDIWELHQKDRIMYVTASDTANVPDIVKQTGAAFINMVSFSMLDMSYQFSQTGKCEFYIGRGEYLASLESLAVKKGNPLQYPLSRRVMEVAESGIFDYWYRLYNPNLTICLNSPTKFAITSTLAIKNIWGMFVVLAGGMGVSLLVFMLELLYSVLAHYL